MSSMIIFVYGEDTFRAFEKMKQMKQAFLDKFDPSGINLAVFPTQDAISLETADILQALCSYPFLGSKRMIIIKGLLEQVKKTDEAVWLDGFSRMPDSTLALFWETATVASVEKKKLFRELMSRGDAHKYSFSTLEGATLNKWVTQRVSARGGNIEPSALLELALRVGPDLWRMAQEIEKLVGFAQNGPIKREMVHQLVPASFESKIFDFMDALSKKQRVHALSLLAQERSAGSDDHYLLIMLGRQVRILLVARACLDQNPKVTKQEAAEAMDVHPFVAQKAIEQAKFLSLSDLITAHDFLFEFDQKIKTGRIDARLAVNLIVDLFLKTA